MVSEYHTRHLGLACFLRYVLGDRAHRATAKFGPSSTSFTFTDEPTGTCQQLADQFFSREGVAVDNVRELLQCDRDMKLTVKSAHADPEGVWIASDEDER